MKKVRNFLLYDITGTVTLFAFLIAIVFVLVKHYAPLPSLLSLCFMYVLKIMIVHYDYVKKVDNTLTDDFIRARIFNLQPYSYHGKDKVHKTDFEETFEKIYVAVFVVFIVMMAFTLIHS